MTTQDQINFQADLSATDDAGITELLDLFGWIVNDAGIGQMQALDALVASQSATGQSRGIVTIDDVNTAFNMIQSEAVKRGLNSVPDQAKGQEYATQLVNGGSADAATSTPSTKVMHTTVAVVSAGVFGLIGFHVGKKWFPKHKWWVVAIMSITGGALGVWASMRYARSKMINMAANSETSEFAGRTRSVGKRTPDKSDPIGTQYITKEGFKGGFTGIIPVVGGPRAGQGKGGVPGGSMSGEGYWIAEGTNLTKKSNQVEFGKNMWWIVTDKGWAPLPALEKA